MTAAHVPDGLDWKAFNGEVKRRGVVLAGGQGKLTGKIFRLGHLGSVTLEEILGAIQHARDRVARAGSRRSSPARPSPPPSAPPWRSLGIAALRRRRGRRVRVLVAEPVAREGIELLAAHHEVDERLGCTREELAAHPARLRRAHRPQPGPGRRRADRRRDPARRHRAGRRRRRQRRPRRRDAGRHHRRQRPDRQHDRGRRAHAGPALRRRPPDRGRRRVASAAASGSAPQFTGLELRGRTLGHRRPGQDRPGHRRPRAGDGDGRPRQSTRS